MSFPVIFPETRTGGSAALSSVLVVGGGLAGLAAGCALAEAGYRVRLLERRPYLGGRASSYQHPGTGEIIDNCQHVLLGVCTNLIDFYQRLGVSGRIRWFDQMNFLEPGGRRSVVRPSRLPAPFHSLPAFWRASAFTLADKFAIARALAELARSPGVERDQPMVDWLARRRQTAGAITRFWRPLLVSALNEDLERMSSLHAAQVIRLSLLSSPEAGRIGVPTVPLTELYARAGDYLESRGGTVELRTSATDFAWSEESRTWSVGVSAGGAAVGRAAVGRDDRRYQADAIVLALPFEAMAKLLPTLPENPAAQRLARDLARFEPSPITGIHLWFDREVTGLDHAILLDRTIQWMFDKSRLQPELRAGAAGSYVELVVSASRSLVGMQRQEIVDLAVAELGEFFPKVREARLVKAAVVKEVRATYSIRPLLDEIRSGARSPWPRIFLAGDWTATGWPATMEGAVRSGYLSAAAVTEEAGSAKRFLVPGLPPRGLMRWLGNAGARQRI